MKRFYFDNVIARGKTFNLKVEAESLGDAIKKCTTYILKKFQLPNDNFKQQRDFLSDNIEKGYTNVKVEKIPEQTGFNFESFDNYVGTILFEAVERITKEEYDEVIRNYFNDDNLFNLTIQTRDMVESQGDLITIRTDNDFYAQWIEGDDVIYLIGIISNKPSRKIDRGDFFDLNSLANQLADKLLAGKKLITSPNLISEKMINFLKLKVRLKGGKVKVDDTGQAFDFKDDPYFKFKTIVITAK